MAKVLIQVMVEPETKEFLREWAALRGESLSMFINERLERAVLDARAKARKAS